MRRRHSLYANFRSSCTYLFRVYMVIYIIYDAYASEICVAGGGYSRLGFICVRACLGAFARMNKSQLQSQLILIPNLAFASCCQQNVCWTRLTMHCRKAGVTCHCRKKDESFQRWFMPAEHAEDVGSRRKIINSLCRLFIEIVAHVNLSLSTILQREHVFSILFTCSLLLLDVST